MKSKSRCKASAQTLNPTLQQATERTSHVATCVAMLQPVGNCTWRATRCNAGVTYASERNAGVTYASECNAGVTHASERNAGVTYASERNAGVTYASERNACVTYASDRNAGGIIANDRACCNHCVASATSHVAT